MKFNVMSDRKHGQQRGQLWAGTAVSHYIAFTRQISAYLLYGSTKRAISSLKCDKHFIMMATSLIFSTNMGSFSG